MSTTQSPDDRAPTESRASDTTGFTERARKEAANVADAARDSVRTHADRSREAGASAIHDVAEAARTAAGEIERSSPELARYAHDAASAVDRLSDTIRNRSFGDLMRSVDDFARREPVAFFGVTMLAGFAVSRFLGSSARRNHGAWTEPGNTAFGSDYFSEERQASSTMPGAAMASPMGTGTAGPTTSPPPSMATRVSGESGPVSRPPSTGMGLGSQPAPSPIPPVRSDLPEPPKH